MVKMNENYESYKIITSENFEKQLLKLNDELLEEIDFPNSSMDERTIKLLSENIKKRRKTEKNFDETFNLTSFLVGYDNTSVFSQQDSSPFPTVSFMHFYLVQTLKGIKEISDSSSKIFADLGCGSGFLGNYTLRNFKSAENGKIIFSDLFYESLDASLGSYLIEKKIDLEKAKSMIEKTKNGFCFNAENSPRLEFLAGDASLTMKDKKADISMACPTYIPYICEVFPQAYFIFGNVSRMIGSDFYFAHSNLADGLVETSAKAVDAKLTEISSKEMPLSIDTFSNIIYQKNPEEIVKLLLPKGLKYKKDEKCKIWHTIRVSKMSF
jgi:hypothetical protein